MYNTEGKRLKHFRKTIGMTQEEFANLLDVQQGFVSRIEADKVFLSYEKLKILVEKKNLNMNYLMTGVGYPTYSHTFNESKAEESEIIYELKAGEKNVSEENRKLKDRLLSVEKELSDIKTKHIILQEKYIQVVENFSPK